MCIPVFLMCLTQRFRLPAVHKFVEGGRIYTLLFEIRNSLCYLTNYGGPGR